jgi:Rieske Fe-S protein
MAEQAAKDPFAPPPKTGIDRRTFVRRTVGSAAVGAVGAGAFSLGVPLSTTLGLKIKRFPYLGAARIKGPAPKGIPMIPIQVDEDGFLNGKTSVEGIGNILEWYGYCSHDAAPGLKESFTQDNKLYYFQNPEKIHHAEDAGIKIWYKDLLDKPLHIDHFTEPGMGAPFKWRSHGQLDNNIITGIAIRVNPSEVKGKTSLLDEFVDRDIIAFCSFCSHFCCVPGFKETKQAIVENVNEMIFCTCHGSVYDPKLIQEYQFPPNG